MEPSRLSRSGSAGHLEGSSRASTSRNVEDGTDGAFEQMPFFSPLSDDRRRSFHSANQASDGVKRTRSTRSIVSSATGGVGGAEQVPSTAEDQAATTIGDQKGGKGQVRTSSYIVRRREQFIDVLWAEFSVVASKHLDAAFQYAKQEELVGSKRRGSEEHEVGSEHEEGEVVRLGRAEKKRTKTSAVAGQIPSHAVFEMLAQVSNRPGCPRVLRQELNREMFTAQWYSFDSLLELLESKGMLGRTEATTAVEGTLGEDIVGSRLGEMDSSLSDELGAVGFSRSEAAESHRTVEVGFFRYVGIKLHLLRDPSELRAGTKILLLPKVAGLSPRRWLLVATVILLAVLGILTTVSFSVQWLKTEEVGVKRRLELFHTAIDTMAERFQREYTDLYGGLLTTETQHLARWNSMVAADMLEKERVQHVTHPLDLGVTLGHYLASHQRKRSARRGLNKLILLEEYYATEHPGGHLPSEYYNLSSFVEGMHNTTANGTTAATPPAAGYGLPPYGSSPLNPADEVHDAVFPLQHPSIPNRTLTVDPDTPDLGKIGVVERCVGPLHLHVSPEHEDLRLRSGEHLLHHEDMTRCNKTLFFLSVVNGTGAMAADASTSHLWTANAQKLLRSILAYDYTANTINRTTGLVSSAEEDSAADTQPLSDIPLEVRKEIAEFGGPNTLARLARAFHCLAAAHTHDEEEVWIRKASNVVSAAFNGGATGKDIYELELKGSISSVSEFLNDQKEDFEQRVVETMPNGTEVNQTYLLLPMETRMEVSGKIVERRTISTVTESESFEEIHFPDGPNSTAATTTNNGTQATWNQTMTGTAGNGTAAAVPVLVAPIPLGGARIDVTSSVDTNTNEVVVVGHGEEEDAHEPLKYSYVKMIAQGIPFDNGTLFLPLVEDLEQLQGFGAGFSSPTLAAFVEQLESWDVHPHGNIAEDYNYHILQTATSHLSTNMTEFSGRFHRAVARKTSNDTLVTEETFFYFADSMHAALDQHQCFDNAHAEDEDCQLLYGLNMSLVAWTVDPLYARAGYSEPNAPNVTGAGVTTDRWFPSAGTIDEVPPWIATAMSNFLVAHTTLRWDDTFDFRASSLAELSLAVRQGNAEHCDSTVGQTASAVLLSSSSSNGTSVVQNHTNDGSDPPSSSGVTTERPFCRSKYDQTNLFAIHGTRSLFNSDLFHHPNALSELERSTVHETVLNESVWVAKPDLPQPNELHPTQSPHTLFPQSAAPTAATSIPGNGSTNGTASTTATPSTAPTPTATPSPAAINPRDYSSIVLVDNVTRVKTTQNVTLGTDSTSFVSFLSRMDVSTWVTRTVRFIVDLADAVNMASTSTKELVIGAYNATSEELKPQLTAYRFEDECVIHGECQRFPPSTRTSQAAINGGEGWSIYPDYRPESVIGGYSSLPLFNVTVVLERDVEEIQAKGLEFLTALLDDMNRGFVDSTEIELVKQVGTPPMHYFLASDSCPEGVDCLSLPGVGVAFRYDCQYCFSFPMSQSEKNAREGTTFAMLTKLKYEERCARNRGGNCTHYLVTDLQSWSDYRLLTSAQGSVFDEKPVDSGVDYSGEPVLRKMSYLTNYSVGLVVKFDSAEFTAPVQNALVLAVLICVCFIVVGIAVVLLTTRQSLDRVERIAKEKRDKLTKDKAKFTSLVKDVLPSVVANQFLAGRSVVAEHHSSVSIIAADLCQFSTYVKNQLHRHVLRSVSYYLSIMDSTAEAAGVTKVRTVGDTHFSVSFCLMTEQNELRESLTSPPQHQNQRAILETSQSTIKAMRFASALALFFSPRYKAMPQVSVTHKDFFREYGRIEKKIPMPPLRIALHQGPLSMGIANDEHKVHFDCYGPSMHVVSRVLSVATEGRIFATPMFKETLSAQDGERAYQWAHGVKCNTRWYGWVPTFKLHTSRQAVYHSVVDRFGLQPSAETFRLGHAGESETPGKPISMKKKGGEKNDERGQGGDAHSPRKAAGRKSTSPRKKPVEEY